MVLNWMPTKEWIRGWGRSRLSPDPGSKVGKENWFDFNDLNFKFGTAEIVPDSRKELEDIVKILQAYQKWSSRSAGIPTR